MCFGAELQDTTGKESGIRQEVLDLQSSAVTLLQALTEVEATPVRKRIRGYLMRPSNRVSLRDFAFSCTLQSRD